MRICYIFQTVVFFISNSRIVKNKQEGIIVANLLNRKATKKYILEKCITKRPGWECGRVSKQALDEIEFFVMSKIDESIRRHPTLGKTFMHFD